MSGGSFDYLCYKISYALDQMHEFTSAEYDPVLGAYRPGGYPFRQKHYQRLIKHIRKVEKVLHDIEWAMDGDISIEECDKTTKNFLNSIRRNKHG